MARRRCLFILAVSLSSLLPAVLGGGLTPAGDAVRVTVREAAAHDVSPPLTELASADRTSGALTAADVEASPPTAAAEQKQLTAAAVEQTEQGTKGAPALVASFDGLG